MGSWNRGSRELLFHRGISGRAPWNVCNPSDIGGSSSSGYPPTGWLTYSFGKPKRGAMRRGECLVDLEQAGHLPEVLLWHGRAPGSAHNAMADELGLVPSGMGTSIGGHAAAIGFQTLSAPLPAATISGVIFVSRSRLGGLMGVSCGAHRHGRNHIGDSCYAERELVRCAFPGHTGQFVIAARQARPKAQ